jgi:predicted class III extradiol MEMO1 family dioxygenase
LNIERYLQQEGVAFVISSDFCHWGKRFSYTPYNPDLGPIHKSIEEMDKEGMQLIASGDPLAFSGYLFPFLYSFWALQ